jgi:hypothetical protein
MTALVSWWRYPENAIGSRFGDAFDIQGIVPVAYALFAVALGIAVGTIFRRVLPAIATTLGIFVALRVAIAIYVRPHFMTAITKALPLEHPDPAGAWVISSGLVGPHGHLLGDHFSLSQLPAACRSAFPGGQGLRASCFAAHGFRELLSYQPANRFWAFQGIESGIFVLLAAVLLLFAYRWVLRRDA